MITSSATPPSLDDLAATAKADDISSFRQRFVTVSSLSEETGYHRNTIRSLFAAGRVPRFAPDGQDFGPVYLRSEADKALK